MGNASNSFPSAPLNIGAVNFAVANSEGQQMKMKSYIVATLCNCIFSYYKLRDSVNCRRSGLVHRLARLQMSLYILVDPCSWVKKKKRNYKLQRIEWASCHTPKQSVRQRKLKSENDLLHKQRQIQSVHATSSSASNRSSHSRYVRARCDRRRRRHSVRGRAAAAW